MKVEAGWMQVVEVTDLAVVKLRKVVAGAATGLTRSVTGMTSEGVAAPARAMLMREE